MGQQILPKSGHPIMETRLDPGALIYESYMVPAQFAPCADVLLGVAEPRTGERVLDVACGTGIVARRVAVAIGETGSVIGLDSNSGMLGVARAQPSKAGASTIDYREGTGMQLPFGDGEFDLVTCSQGLQFFPDRARGLAEMHRVLRPGGRVALALWTDAVRSPLVNALNESGIRHAGVALAAAPFSLSDRNEIEALLQAAGFATNQINEHVIECRFEQPSRMPQLAIAAAFAAVPQLRDLDETTKERIRAGVLGDLGPVIAAHTRGDVLVTSQATHVALAHKPYQ